MWWGAYELLFGMWATILVGYDVCFRRLPNSLTYAGLIAAIICAGVTQPWLILGGLCWSGLYIMLNAMVGGIGGGDIKLAATLGIVAATSGWWGWWVAVAGASISGVVALIISGKNTLPHGPAMIASTALVVVWQHFFL